MFVVSVLKSRVCLQILLKFWSPYIKLGKAVVQEERQSGTRASREQLGRITCTLKWKESRRLPRVLTGPKERVSPFYQSERVNSGEACSHEKIVLSTSKRKKTWLSNRCICPHLQRRQGQVKSKMPIETFGACHFKKPLEDCICFRKPISTNWYQEKLKGVTCGCNVSEANTWSLHQEKRGLKNSSLHITEITKVYRLITAALPWQCSYLLKGDSLGGRLQRKSCESAASKSDRERWIQLCWVSNVEDLTQIFFYCKPI